MTSPLERAAAALREMPNWPYGDDRPTEDEMKPIVRAVLTAIREPSITMTGVGANSGAEDTTAAQSCWQAMIDAALSEGG